MIIRGAEAHPINDLLLGRAHIDMVGTPYFQIEDRQAGRVRSFDLTGS